LHRPTNALRHLAAPSCYVPSNVNRDNGSSLGPGSRFADTDENFRVRLVASNAPSPRRPDAGCTAETHAPVDPAVHGSRHGSDERPAAAGNAMCKAARRIHADWIENGIDLSTALGRWLPDHCALRHRPASFIARFSGWGRHIIVSRINTPFRSASVVSALLKAAVLRGLAGLQTRQFPPVNRSSMCITRQALGLRLHLDPQPFPENQLPRHHQWGRSDDDARRSEPFARSAPFTAASKVNFQHATT